MEIPQQKIPGSVKKWKVPGKISITTVSKKNFEKISDDDDGGFSNAKSSTISGWIQAYKWSKWPLADAVETDPRGILFYWKSKKLE